MEEEEDEEEIKCSRRCPGVIVSSHEGGETGKGRGRRQSVQKGGRRQQPMGSRGWTKGAGRSSPVHHGVPVEGHEKHLAAASRAH